MMTKMSSIIPNSLIKSNSLWTIVSQWCRNLILVREVISISFYIRHKINQKILKSLWVMWISWRWARSFKWLIITNGRKLLNIFPPLLKTYKHKLNSIFNILTLYKRNCLICLWSISISIYHLQTKITIINKLC